MIARFFCWSLITILCSSASYGDDWTDYISRLERSDAQTKKQRLPQAYRDYAWQLMAKRPNDAMRNMEKAISLAEGGRKQSYRGEYGDLLLRLAFRKVKDRKDNDYQDREARKLAEKALKYNGNLSDAHLLIGDVAYDNQDLHGAKLSWTRAQLLDPKDKFVKERLAKIETESSVESAFSRDNSGFFDVRYEKNVGETTASSLRKYLEWARKEVGDDFRYFPRHKLVVLAYSQTGFNRIVNGRGPGWWAAFYDGKIRLPVNNSGEQIEPLLVHEYTHAIVHDLSRGRCPKWLNEGLAEFQEAKVRMPNLHLLRRAVQAERLIPLHGLNDALVNSSHATGALAYQQSYSLVTYLNHKYGFSRVRQILEQLGSGESVDDAIQSELKIGLAELEQDWKTWVPELVR